MLVVLIGVALMVGIANQLLPMVERHPDKIEAEAPDVGESAAGRPIAERTVFAQPFRLAAIGRPAIIAIGGDRRPVEQVVHAHSAMQCQ